MRLVTFLFADSSGGYGRMHKALSNSVLANSPSTKLETIYVPAKDHEIKQLGLGQYPGYINNARKTKHHNEYLQSVPAGDTEMRCLIDCDTLVLRDLGLAESFHHDLLYTTRPSEAKFLINSGVLLVKPSPKTKDFFQRWYDTVLLMLACPEIRLAWHDRYGGINQCGLARTLAERHDLIVGELPCREWNSVSESWGTAMQEARVVHLLDRLRRACLGIVADRMKWPFKELVKEWEKYERGRVPAENGSAKQEA